MPQRWMAPIVLLCAVLACGSDPGPPEAQIRALLGAAESAAEAKNTKALKRSISEAYADPGGRDKRAVGGLLAFTLLRHESIHLLTRIDAISFPEPGRALATVYAAMAGGPIPGAGALSGRRADLYRFDFVFAEEEPTRWLLVRAEWRPAHADDFF